MKPYPKYKDSGIAWLEEIPAHWEISRLKYETKKIIDGTHFTPNYTTKGVPFLRVTDIHNSEINLNEVKRISEEEHKELNKRCDPQKGDVLLSKNGTIGIIKVIDWDWEFSIFVSLCLIKFNSSIHNRYFSFFFESHAVSYQIYESSQKTSVTNLHLDKIKELLICFPAIPEQTTIASYLDRKTAEIDNLIAKKERLLELYEEEKTAIINQAVTKGINPDVKMKDSGVEWLGDIPEHWTVKRLKYEGQFINGYSFKSKDFTDSGVRILKISNIQHMRIDWTDSSFTRKKNYEKFSDFQVIKKDLVFALTRPIISTGIKAAIIDSDDEILINQRNSIFRTSKIETNWIYYTLLCNQFISEFDSLIDKTGQQPNISSNDIGNIFIPVPSVKEQKNVVTYLQTQTAQINDKAQKTKKLIELLKEYRSALISEVVTGKIDVSSMKN